MAESNDLSAHMRSLNMLPKGKERRTGSRYAFNANQEYQIPISAWEKLKPASNDWIKFIQWYVNDHFSYQQPRILELERYYQADNNIHYWLSKNQKKNRADNRIASAIARYITNIQVGYEFGTPLKFGYTNSKDENDNGEEILNELDVFNQQNNEPYHEKIMGKNLSNTGRAYELLYVPEGTTTPQVQSVDPNSAFVVYSTDIKPIELFGVRYYSVNVKGQINYQVEVYTATNTYYFTAGGTPDADWKLDNTTEHHFKDVPLTEFKMNEERVGLWEPDLDKMDSYDLLISEMVNSQEDFNNASLLVTGKIANNASKPEVMLDGAGRPLYENKQGGYTDQPTNDDGSTNSPVMVQKVLDTHANVIYVRPYVVDQPNGSKLVSNPTAQYLTKDFDMNGWKINIDQLMSDIHKETNTPDTSDQNFAANASGVAMSYKLFGSDQEMSFSETLYSEAVHRRMRMLASYWGIIPNSKVSLSKDVNPADNVQITFTPNLPKNNQETIQTVQGLVSTGDVSKKTIREMLSTVTGIPEDQEAQRIEEEQQQSGDDTADKVAQAIQKLHANVSPDDSEDDNDTGGDDNGDSETGQEEDNPDGQAGQKE